MFIAVWGLSIVLVDLFRIPTDSTLLSGSYNYALVLLSLLIAILSSSAALFSVELSRQNPIRWQQQLGLVAGSVSLSIGIWSMHFIGMLAFQLCTPVEYLSSITLLSLIPSVLASWVALNLLTRDQIKIMQLVIGGVLVGAGIGAMHYSGMAAMQMAVQLRYDPFFFALSIFVAVIMAFLALWIRFGIQSLQASLPGWQLNLLSGIVMGVAISAMHYTGMLAARFVAPVGFTAAGETANSQQMALIVTSVSLLVTLMVLLVQAVMKFYHAKHSFENSTTRLSAIMNTALDAILTFDHKGTVIDSNKAAQKLFAVTAGSLTGRHFKQLLPKHYADEYIRLLAQAEQHDASQLTGNEQQITIITDSNDAIPVRLMLSRSSLHERPIYVACLSDISKQLATAKTLKESEQKFRSLIQNIPGAAYRCLPDKNWSMLFISDAVEILCGYPAHEFLLPNAQRNWAELILAEDQHLVSKINHKETFTLEYRIRHKDGSIRWLLEQGEPLRDEQGNILALDGFIMDISERRSFEERLQQAKQKAEQAAEVKTAFLANMSHEIRTPLNAVIGFTELLLENPESPDAIRYIQTVNQSAKSLLVLLNDILDSAKLEKGKLELEQLDFNLTELVDNVISTLWVNARKKQLALHFSLSPALQPYYFGAASRIRQVLLNLLGNAIKFTEQGTVTLDVSAAEQQVVFTITDTGIGIAAERLSSIFDPFTQADASMSRRFGGTGLGTTISKQLVELMGGTISVSSTLGQGSTFTVKLPLSPGKAIATTEKTHKLPPLHFLIADDIPQNLELLTAILQRDKHQVSTATNGEEVLAALQRIQPDLVLLDVQMPVMDGLTATSLRREYEAANNLPAIPIIALTASALAEDRHAVLAAGMDGFASKPIDTDALFTEIARVLRIPLQQSSPSIAAQQVDIIAFAKGAQLWGNQQKHYAELQRFSNGPLQHFCEDILTAQNAADKLTLQRIAHSYKGLTGNLCLQALTEGCQQLELALRDADWPGINEQIKQLCFTAEQSRKAINNLQTAAQPQAEPSVSTDAKILPQLLQSLHNQLASFTYDDVLLRQLQQLADAGVYTEPLIRITEATEAFDFEQAQGLIASLLIALEQ